MTVSLYKRPSHMDGIRAAEKIARDHGIPEVELRWFASHHMSEVYPDLEEIGSSDVSIHLSSLGNYEPHLLVEEAARIRDREALLTKITAASGRSREETLEGLRALLAPA